MRLSDEEHKNKSYKFRSAGKYSLTLTEPADSYPSTGLVWALPGRHQP